MAAVFPASWFHPGAQQLVLDFLRNMPVTPEDRKQALIEWADRAGVTLTAEMVEAVTGLPAGEV